MTQSVSLIWSTLDGDKNIAYLARVSNSKATPDMPASKLIGYLLRNHHWSPFEMASMCVEIHTTRDISAQILRHRSFSFQEFSTRYAEVEELLTERECRFQDVTNRQNSFEATSEQQEDIDWWNKCVANTAGNVLRLYRHALNRGIAKEVARAILPIGLMPTKMYMTGTVRSWIHYCAERTKPGVQKEHRKIAEEAQNILYEAFPDVARAIVAEELRAAQVVTEN